MGCINVRISIENKLTGRIYDVEIDPGHTVKDVIDMLTEEGYIPATPFTDYYWVLVDSRGIAINEDEALATRVRDGDKLSLVAVYTPG